MTDETTATPITALVDAGENIFSTVTGKQGETQKKIADGAARLLDGALPALANRVSFNLDSVIEGATDILYGIALVLTGLKKKKEQPVSTNDEAPNTTPHVGGIG